MKHFITIVVIAHNEEAHIEACLESLICQSITPHKIIVVVHNSTDDTLAKTRVLRHYPNVEVRVATTKESGVPHARLAAFEYVDPEGIVLCLDGDSVAAPNWIETLYDMLTGPHASVLAGTLVRFRGNWFCRLMNISHWFMASATGKKAAQWIWGTSFGFQAAYLDLMKSSLSRSISMQRMAHLSNSLEDYIRGMDVYNQCGAATLAVTRTSWVKTWVKEKGMFELITRTQENLKNKSIIDEFWFRIEK